MAELADAYGSGPYESNFMQVQVLLPAPNENNPNLTPIGDGFGLFFYFDRYENTYFPNGVIKLPESKPRGPEIRKSAIRKTGKAAPIIGELHCLLLCYSASCGAFTLFAFSICYAFHSVNSRCPSSLS